MAAAAPEKHSTLPHSLAICTQLDLRGELLELCVASALELLARNVEM